MARNDTAAPPPTPPSLIFIFSEKITTRPRPASSPWWFPGHLGLHSVSISRTTGGKMKENRIVHQFITSSYLAAYLDRIFCLVSKVRQVLFSNLNSKMCKDLKFHKNRFQFQFLRFCLLSCHHSKCYFPSFKMTVLYFFKGRSQEVQADLELYTQLPTNSWPPCCPLLSAGITDG